MRGNRITAHGEGPAGPAAAAEAVRKPGKNKNRFEPRTA
ncbi:hypothetical protein B4135_2803 [Caldibacillus debilis]|uniref:Uncharacterized protein n=1 Tax=Caldibacillus debilis TaxID=301148 RepID=A0A150LQS1_9BACI|nr:hypothetical protein B4135_2803 [Caldibacillus debilis]